MPTSPGKNRAGRRTADRLLDAAERLIATSGPTVPLRQITKAAGQKNNSAITYHFGSRQGLVDAVWTRRSERVNRVRAEMLAAMEADGSTDDLRALLEAHVLPLAGEIGAHLPSYWARFNEVALSQMPLIFLDTFDDDLAQRAQQEVPLRTLAHVFLMMRKQVGDGSEPAAGLRVALMVRFVIAGLATWERDQELGRVDGASLPAYADSLVEFGHGLLTQPSSALPIAAQQLHG